MSLNHASNDAEGGGSQAVADGTPPVLFILGAPRSGTSLVYRALSLHPNAVWISNYQRRVPRAARLAVINRVANAFPETRRRVWFGADGDTAYRYNGERSILDRWFPQPVEGEPLFRHRAIPEQSESRTPTPQQLKLRDDFRAMAQVTGGKVVVSKRIGHNLRIPLLHSIFPQARFVDIQRDGRAVAASLVNVDWWEHDPLWWYDGTPQQAVARGIDPMVLAVTHWSKEVAAIAAGLRDVPAEQVLHVRYEQLVADPMDTLSHAAAFGGLSDEPTWRIALQHLRFPNRNDGWRAQFGDRADEVIAAQAESLAALGYLE